VEALLVNAVSPEVGGVLVRGQRGNAKSTAVRGLAPLLPAVDAAASGVARVEREAVSVEHDARFLLVGTMNPEEGELRPQLLDRFGLGVEVTTPADPAQRAEIVRRRLAFEHDPAGFAEQWARAERELAGRIAAARSRLAGVVLPERELRRITAACAKLELDGVRGDIVTARAARALAALQGASEVDGEHVRRAAALALAHRRRRDPLDDRGGEGGELDRALEDEGDGRPEPEPPSGGAGGDGGVPESPPGSSAAAGPAAGSQAPVGQGREEPRDERSEEPHPGRRATPAAEQREAPGGEQRPAAAERRDAPTAAHLPLGALTLPGAGQGPAGRRARSASPAAGSIDARPAVGEASEIDDLAVVATLQARLAGDGTPREHVRAGRESALLCLVVDASGSMGARRRLARVKGALLEVLREAYARRDRLAIVAFRDGHARTAAAPGAPVEQAAAAIRDLATGGRTPLAAGLDAAERIVRREAIRDPRRRAVAIVLTDGRVADAGGEIRAAARRLGRAASTVHVVDTEEGRVRLGLAADLAAAAGAGLHALHPPPSSRRAA